MSNPEYLYIKSPETISSSYVNFVKGYTQTPSDALNAIKDYCGGVNGIIGVNDTYASLFNTPYYITVPSSTASASSTKGFRFNWSASQLWSMESSKCMILAFVFKSSAKPTSSGFVMGNRGPGTSGWELGCDSSIGGIQLKISDVGMANTFYGTRSANICDGVDHVVTLIADSNTKKAILAVDGVIIENIINTTFSSSTAPTFATCVGSSGNPNATGTWDTNSTPTSTSFGIRSIHYLLTPSLPSNYKTIIQYLNTPSFINSAIPAALLG